MIEGLISFNATFLFFPFFVYYYITWNYVF